MDRMEEYKMLLAEAETAPQALNFTVSRARARLRNEKHARFIGIPLGSVAAAFIVFVLMVNVSTSFAYAIGRIPLLKELAAAVAFSPSLSAAVDNAYVQPVEQEQTANGITMRVEYVIVDQKQLNIFYTLQSDVYSNPDIMPEILGSDGTDLEGFSLGYGHYGADDSPIRRITVDFTDNDMPSKLKLLCKVYDKGGAAASEHRQIDLYEEPVFEEPEYISNFEFLLEFNPMFTQQGEVIELNRSFDIDGQRLTVTTVEVYPTHMRINFADDEGNTAWLRGLSYYIEDEKGNRFEQISNGIVATGSPDSPMMRSHRLESTFFRESESLTLHITGAVWLDKARERVKLDLKNKTAEALPEGVAFESAVKSGDGWKLEFSAEARQENAHYQLFLTDYFGETGNKYSFNSWYSGAMSVWDEQTKEYTEVPGRFLVSFALKDYPYDTVLLSPDYTRTSTLAQPVVIQVK